MVFNYYDDSFPSTIRSYISGAIDFVNNAFTYSGHSEDYLEVYDRIFVDTGFRRNYVLYDDHYTGCSHSDGCVYDADYCGLDCTNHHKNLERISTTLDAMNQENTLQVLWTDQPAGFFCSIDDVNTYHTPRNYFALVREDALTGMHRQVIHMMNIPESSYENVRASMALLLTHEVAHTLGMEEAFNDPNHNKDLDDWECVMEKYDYNGMYSFYNAIYRGEQLPFCEDCIESLTDILS